MSGGFLFLLTVREYYWFPFPIFAGFLSGPDFPPVAVCPGASTRKRFLKTLFLLQDRLFSFLSLPKKLFRLPLF